MKRVCICCLILAVAAGCSIRKMAVNSMADAMAGGAGVYASDNDPELIRAALPFGLKTMESLLQEAPRNRNLLIAAASGFSQYAYAFVWMDAEDLEDENPVAARAKRDRAQKLYLRARDYGLRALEIDHPGFGSAISLDTAAVLSRMRPADVPALYWTALPWAAAVTQAKGQMDLVADLGVIEAMMRRALELDEGYDHGAIHEFFLSYEAGRAGGSLQKAREHYRRAVDLNRGRKIAPLVSLAEDVCVPEQNRAEFLSLLDRALAFDVNQAPEFRLANLIAQRRARQLKSKLDDLFLEGGEEEQVEEQ